MLCLQCSQIFNKADYKVGRRSAPLTSIPIFRLETTSEPEILGHHASYHDFERCAREVNCHICLLVWNLIPDDARNRLREGDRITAMMIEEPESQLHDDHAYNLRFGVKDPPSFWITTIQLRSIQETKISGIISQPAGSSTPNSAPLNKATDEAHQRRLISGWPQAMQWLKDCIYNHQECRPLSKAEICPASRLLFVGSSKDFSDLRLVEQPKHGWDDIPYAVLSHCWGKPPYSHLQLMKENYDILHTKLEFSQLGSTFQDAVMATRNLPAELNIAHIWIDSLCITQDCQEDKIRELPKMRSIYQYASISFAANFASTGSKGLFQDSMFPETRNIKALQPCIVQPAWDLEKRHFACEDLNVQGNMLENSSLARRAWVLQETILAPRILHFSCQQLFWECYKHTASEAYPNGVLVNWLNRKKFSPDIWRRREGQTYKQQENEVYRNWSSIVMNYTKCRLSDSSDKLRAISGLAMSLQKLLGTSDQYIAGIWKSRLPMALAWRVDCGSWRGERPRNRIAPTWSWASTEGLVDIPPDANQTEESGIRIHAMIEDVNVVYQDNNIALDVIKTEIRIKGAVAPIELLLSEDQQKRREQFDRNLRIKFRLEGVDLRFDEETNKDGSRNVAFCQFDTARGHLATGPIYAMLLYSFDVSELINTTRGLLLQKHASLVDRFERCGVVTLYGSENREIFFETAKKAKLRNSAIDFGNGEYSILLV